MPKYRLLTPGPVAVPERVLRAMAGTLLHHRAPEFLPVLDEVRANLKRVFQTERDVLVLASSGTGAMEATVANLTSPGERAIVVRGGKFGERWAELCETYGVVPVCVDVEWGRAVDPEQVRAAFDREPEARVLFVQASETSTAVYHPIRELCQVVRERPGTLIAVDGISGVGVHDLPMDAWGIDALVSGSQKSWLLPPGLSFVALSERAEARIATARNPRYYFDLRKELAGQRKNSPAYTPAVSLIVGLREALRIILEDGLEPVFARHARLAQLTRTAMQGIGLRLFAPDAPSFACTAVWIPEGIDGKEFVRRLRDQHAMTVADGQGAIAGKVFRIGHMGDLDEYDMLAAVGAVELVLADMGYPAKLGEGVRAALEFLHERVGA